MVGVTSTTMLQIRMASGEEIQITKEAFELVVQTNDLPVRALKQRLQTLLGIPRFRQRLLIEGRELCDSDELVFPMEVEIVLLHFCPVDDRQCRELFAAVALDSAERLETVLAGPLDPDFTSQTVHQNRTALHYAAVCGSARCTRLLLEAGADKDRVSEDGYTALGLATAQGHLEILEILMHAGADLQKAPRGRFTPLSVACCHGDVAVVRFLLDASAETNPDVCRATPLGIACAENHLEVARLLLEARADKNTTMSGSVTAMHLACQRGHAKLVQLLLEADLDTNADWDASFTALLLVSAEHHDVLRLLLRAQSGEIAFGQRSIAAFMAVEQCQLGAAGIILADAIKRRANDVCQNGLLAECLSGLRKWCAC